MVYHTGVWEAPEDFMFYTFSLNYVNFHSSVSLRLLSRRKSKPTTTMRSQLLNSPADLRARRVKYQCNAHSQGPASEQTPFGLVWKSTSHWDPKPAQWVCSARVLSVYLLQWWRAVCEKSSSSADSLTIGKCVWKKKKSCLWQKVSKMIAFF